MSGDLDYTATNLVSSSHVPGFRLETAVLFMSVYCYQTGLFGIFAHVSHNFACCITLKSVFIGLL